MDETKDTAAQAEAPDANKAIAELADMFITLAYGTVNMIGVDSASDICRRAIEIRRAMDVHEVQS